MPSELSGIALVTGGGRGIGADVARELASAGMRVAVSARTRAQVEAVAQEIGGLAIEADVSKPADVERMVAETERELGPIDLLVANAGIALWEERAWEVPVEDWWRVQEVNVLGVYLTCRAAIPGMLERGSGRIVITGSGAAYLPGSSQTAYGASKAAAVRFGETLANQLQGRIPVFPISPGLVKTEMIADRMGDDAPWTPPEQLEQRIDQIVADDLNAIRLRRD
jgi:NAD(P)-dependent dehydrogenase (short-subunit alcohol dehydrogenase family)